MVSPTNPTAYAPVWVAGLALRAALRAGEFAGLDGPSTGLAGLCCHRAASVAQFKGRVGFLVLAYAQWARACPVSFDLT